jgi:hypothetical protein
MTLQWEEYSHIRILKNVRWIMRISQPVPGTVPREEVGGSRGKWSACELIGWYSGLYKCVYQFLRI